MKPLYIFDLDGTLALIEHRRPILADKTDPHRWSKFYKACVDDTPNLPVLNTAFYLQNVADVWVFSGRSVEVFAETVDWLHRLGFVPHKLKMRPERDYTPDEVLKEQWLNEMLAEDRQRLVAMFDDRDKVVAMWRRNDIACFQVASGDF